MSEQRRMIPITDPTQIPDGMSEKEAHEFWSTHELTEEYYEKTGPPPEEDLPPNRLPAERTAGEGDG